MGFIFLYFVIKNIIKNYFFLRDNTSLQSCPPWQREFSPRPPSPTFNASGVSWVKVRRPVPPRVTPGRPRSLPGFALCPRICRDGRLHRLRGDTRTEKTCITLQGKLVRPKLVSVRWGGCEQWQLSVRQRLQRSAEWLLWVILCCRSLRKFTDVFSYETPL